MGVNMRNKMLFFAFVLLFSFIPLKAQTRGENPEISKGFCTATLKENPRKMEWIIYYNSTGEIVLQENQLWRLPLAEGGYVKLVRGRNPVFTCTSDAIYFLIYKTVLLQFGQNTWRETRTILYKKNIWAEPEQSQVVFATPLSNESTENFDVKTNDSNLLVSVRELTDLLSQQNRLVILGKFEIHFKEERLRISYAALELDCNNSVNLIFESGPFDLAKAESKCITLNELYFVQRIGPLYTEYQVNKDGNIIPLLFRWNNIKVKCGPYNAVITSNRSSSDIFVPRPEVGRGR